MTTTSTSRLPLASPTTPVTAGGERASLLQLLRSETRESHHALDSGLTIGDAAPTMEAYRAFLRTVASVLLTLEPAVARWLGPPPLERVPLLVADLADLGSAPPPAFDAPLPHDQVEAFGAAYVIEGSALGGAVLARRVATSLGDDTPRRYLTLHGPGTASHFRTFCSALDELGARLDDQARTRACVFASQIFGAYQASAKSLGAIRDPA